MSEKITHTAVMDDCFRLALASGKLCPAFVETMRGLWDFARLGSGTRAGDRHSVQLLTSFRERWPERRPEERLEPKLAFVLGWLCHRAADRQMKPVFRQAEPDRTQKPSECSVYHEAFLFREIFCRDPERLYTAATLETDLGALPAAKILDTAAVREVFHTLMQQALIEIHTFSPDEDNIETWLDGLFGLQQDFYVDVERYAAAVAQPDPDKVRRFISEVNFYDREEPIILTARALQRGETLASEAVCAAIGAGAQSHYAQALKMGCGYVLAASDFFEGRLSADELRERFDIGKAGWDGKSV